MSPNVLNIHIITNFIANDKHYQVTYVQKIMFKIAK